MNKHNDKDTDVVLEVQDIYKKFKNHEVIKNVSLRVRQKEIVGLFGPNGSGKSTIFKILTRFLDVDKGAVYSRGQNITKLPPHLLRTFGIAYVPQDFSLFPELTVWKNIKMALQIAKVSITRQQLIETLEKYGLSEKMDLETGRLSGGQKRRTEIARAMCLNPSILLLDEPFAGIDPVGIDSIVSIFDQIREDGTAVVLTDHNLRVSLPLCSRAYVLLDGIIAYEGNQESLLKNTELRNRYFGSSFSSEPASVKSA